MIPQQGQYVKIFLRNSMIIEGLVEEWTDQQVVLKLLLSDESFAIVHRPGEDILVTKVGTQPTPVQTDKPSSEIRQEIVATLKEAIKPEVEPEIQKMNLTQLRQLVVQQDRKIIEEKRKEHFGSVGASKMAVPYSNITDLKIARKDK